MPSIATTLGAGSGVDTKKLVSDLVDASFANRNKLLADRNAALTTQISTAGQLKSGIARFASALETLAAGGSLAAQPVSSNAAIASVSRLNGSGAATGADATLEVRRLAQGQVSASDPFAAGATTPLGGGTLTLRFGSASVVDGAMQGFAADGAAPVTIAIDPARSTLTDIAAAINAADSGVRASIVTDGAGARLVLKGPSGANRGFTLDADGALAGLAVGPGAAASRVTSAAQDAELVLDGVTLHAPANRVDGLIDGVRIDLAAAAPGVRVTITTTTPDAAITQAVSDVVDTYNALFASVAAAVDPKSGTLRSDPAAKALLRGLKAMTLTPLVAGAAAGAPATLADLGVATQRDGTLKLDPARLRGVIAAQPAAVTAILAEPGGLTALVGRLAADAASADTGLGASEAGYNQALSRNAEAQTRSDGQAERMRTRMTQQFASMDTRVAAYKATQSFLTQQVDSWNASRR